MQWYTTITFMLDIIHFLYIRQGNVASYSVASSWFDMVTDLEPLTGSYAGITDMLLEPRNTYQFQLVAYEGDVVTENDNDDIEELRPTKG